MRPAHAQIDKPEAIAHMLAYDAAQLGNGHPPTARLGKITQALTPTGARFPPGAVWRGWDA